MLNTALEPHDTITTALEPHDIIGRNVCVVIESFLEPILCKFIGRIGGILGWPLIHVDHAKMELRKCGKFFGALNRSCKSQIPNGFLQVFLYATLPFLKEAEMEQSTLMITGGRRFEVLPCCLEAFRDEFSFFVVHCKIVL